MTRLDDARDQVIAEAILVIQAVDDVEPEFCDDELFREHRDRLNLISPLREAVEVFQREQLLVAVGSVADK